MGCITFEPDFKAVGEGIDGCNRSPKEYHRHKFVGGRSTTQGGQLLPTLLESRGVIRKLLGLFDLPHGVARVSGGSFLTPKVP